MSNGSILVATSSRERDIRMGLRSSAPEKKTSEVKTITDPVPFVVRAVRRSVPAGEVSTVFDMLGLAVTA